uniref:Putative metalloprotease n=1 Tax=Ixodes ricinus TaxID=34613 RepID=A0A0K8R589_IXORI
MPSATLIIMTAENLSLSSYKYFSNSVPFSILGVTSLSEKPLIKNLSVNIEAFCSSRCKSLLTKTISFPPSDLSSSSLGNTIASFGDTPNSLCRIVNIVTIFIAA